MGVALFIRRIGVRVWVKGFTVCPVALACLAHAQDAPSPAPVDPFNNPERIQYFLKRTFSWQKMTVSGAESLLGHAVGGTTKWGGGPFGIASRYGDTFGRRITRNSIELGMGMALHEDIRYKRSHETGIVRRLRYATTHALLATTPDGSFRPAYSRIAASIGTEAISSMWAPRRQSPGDMFRCATWSLLDRIPSSYIDEFAPDLIGVGRQLKRKWLARLKKQHPVVAVAPQPEPVP